MFAWTELDCRGAPHSPSEAVEDCRPVVYTGSPTGPRPYMEAGTGMLCMTRCPAGMFSSWPLRLQMGT